MTSVNILLLLIVVPGVLSGCCPNNWVAYEDSCYLYADDISLDWIEATYYCAAHGAHLVTIETKEEDTAIKNFALKLFKGGYKYSSWFWIGAIDDEIEGQWVWYTNHNALNYTSWFRTETIDRDATQDCAVLWGPFNFEWGDYYCTVKGHVICELDAGKSEVGVGASIHVLLG